MKKIISFSTVLVFVATFFATASVSAKPYGMAGCGIGALVFGNQPGKIQIVAATLNNLISPQTSAITSGTSNCHEDGILKAEAEQQIYVEMNLDGIKAEMAMGKGEKLNSLAYLMGCSKDSMPSFGSTARANLDKIIVTNEENSAEWVHYRLKGIVSGDKELSASCSRFIK